MISYLVQKGPDLEYSFQSLWMGCVDQYLGYFVVFNNRASIWILFNGLVKQQQMLFRKQSNPESDYNQFETRFFYLDFQIKRDSKPHQKRNIHCRLSLIAVLKIKTMSHAQYLWKLAWS